MEATAIPQNVQAVDMDSLFRLKGELTTQIEIANGRLQQVNLQLQNIINAQMVQPPLKA